MAAEDSIEVGRVGKPHGVRGELRIQLHWSHSDSLLHADDVLLVRSDGTSARYGVEHARPVPRAVLLKLRGIDDRDMADALRGAQVLVERGALPALDDDEYYLVD